MGPLTTDASRSDLAALLAQTIRLRDEIDQQAPALLRGWGFAGDERDAPPNLRNLARYIALRRHDLCALQERLRRYGLSSMGASEAGARAALDALIATLQRLCGEDAAPYPPASALEAGRAALDAGRRRLFGPERSSANAFVMATLPNEAAADPELVARLIEAGMDCARINCAHDEAADWTRMIDNIRAAERGLGRRCRVFMDIAGPKCRIAAVRAPEKLRLYHNDRLSFARDVAAAPETIAFSPTFPQAVTMLKPGDTVWINDGKIGARVIGGAGDARTLEIFSARGKGERLKVGKGLNFPKTDLGLPPLTDKDLHDLDFVAQHADIVGFSFVQRPSDVTLLQDRLAARRGPRPPQPLVLKIETPLAVHNLPALLVQSTLRHPTGVMIARGDLAVELGFARLSEMQEEILWLCEAAHTPVIWATQVLDQFVKEGVLIRPEMTDAAMAQRADCVMLNKGPYLAEAVAFLRDILSRMDRHHARKAPRLTPLAAWS